MSLIAFDNSTKTSRLDTLVVFVLLIAIIFYIFSSIYHINYYNTDIRLYVQGATYAVHHVNPYSIEGITYRYPPFALFLIAPLTFFSDDFGSKVWMAFSFGCLVISIMLMVSMLLANIPLRAKLMVLLYFLLIYPTKQSILLGQINSVVLLCIVMSFYCFRRISSKYTLFRQFSVGFWVGLGAAIKITPMFLLLYFVIKRQWYAIIFAVVSFIFANALAMLVFSVSVQDVKSYIDFMFTLTSTAAAPFDYAGANVQLNQSVASLLYSIGVSANATRFIAIASLLLIVVLLMVNWNKYKNTFNHIFLYDWELYSLCVGLSVFWLGAFTWEHHLMLMYPLVLFSILHLASTDRWVYISSFLIIGIFYIDPTNGVALAESAHAPRILYYFVRYHGLVSYALALFIFIRSNSISYMHLDRINK